MGDLDALIPKTQELLQPLVPKPKLADKLLAKPPFRFLHDIFTALATATGFGKGLFNDFELDSTNVKEKHQKTAYLDKMIVCVGFCLGKDVDVRSAKIVAGLEPENTNIFLQDLATAAGNASLDWARAVQKTLDKMPSLTLDGGVAVTGGGGGAPSEAKASVEAPARPASKEKSSTPSDADKAAAAEAKAAKERAKREKEDAEKKEIQRQESLKAEAKTEIKTEAAAPPPASRKKSVSDNNTDVDDALQQQIRECNGDFERTKDVVEKVITKPKMAVKLLSKPPFRFLHDIVSEVTRVTGFADGLYSGEELDSNAIKEKQPKIDYLTKIISCTSVHLNVEIEAKPAKIVAGLEPEETNKWLQLLAIACRHGSSTDAVQRVLAGDTALRASSAGTKKPKAAAREATPEAKLSSRSTTPQETKTRAPEKEAKEQPAAAAPAVAAGGFVAPMKPLKTAGDDDDDGGNLKFPSSDAKGEGDDDGSAEHRAPGTSGGMGTSRTSRPTTARRRPPKLKENVTEVGRMHVPDLKVAAVTGIMKDGDNADSDDEDATAGGGGGDSNNSSRPSSSSSTNHVDGAQHGRLVSEILKNEEAARKEREDEDAKEAAGGPTLEAETGIRLGRRKKSFKDKSNAAATSAAEMNELRMNIQRICQATLPMGKAIEFVHEDLDAMSKELDKWKKEYEKKCEVYEDEKKKTDEALQPLQVQLLEVEELIKEQVHKINTLKGTIAKNEEKTQKLLRMVVSA